MTKELEEYKASVANAAELWPLWPPSNVNKYVPVLEEAAQALLRVIDALGDSPERENPFGAGSGEYYKQIARNEIRQKIIDAILNKGE